MENKKSLLITFTLIISAHLLLFANLDLEEKVVVAQNKPAANISKINLKNVVIKKPEPKVEPVVEPIVEKIIEKPLPETKSKNIVKQEKKKWLWISLGMVAGILVLGYIGTALYLEENDS